MGDNEIDRTLWCGNLDPNVTEEILFELFLQAGPLESARIATRKDGTKQNFSFIRFKHSMSVPYTISLMDNIRLFGRSLKLQTRPGSVHQNNRNGPPQQANQVPPGMMPSPNQMHPGMMPGIMGPPQQGFNRSYSSPGNLDRFGNQTGGRSPMQGQASPNTPDSGRRGHPLGGNRYDPYPRNSRDQRNDDSSRNDSRDSRDSRGSFNDRSRDRSRDSRDDRSRDSRDNRSRDSRDDRSRDDRSRDRNNRNNSGNNYGRSNSFNEMSPDNLRVSRFDRGAPMPGGMQQQQQMMMQQQIMAQQQMAQQMNPQNRFMQQQQSQGSPPPWHQNQRGGRQKF